jgi:hypothetical protein
MADRQSPTHKRISHPLPLSESPLWGGASLRSGWVAAEAICQMREDLTCHRELRRLRQSREHVSSTTDEDDDRLMADFLEEAVDHRRRH